MAQQYMTVSRSKRPTPLDYESRTRATNEEGIKIQRQIQRYIPEHEPGRFEPIGALKTALRRNPDIGTDPYLVPAIPDPYGTIAVAIREKLLTIPFGRPVKLHFQNWTLDQLGSFLQPTEDSVFYVSLTLVEQVWRTNANQYQAEMFEGRVFTFFGEVSKLSHDIGQEAMEGYGISNVVLKDSIVAYREERMRFRQRRHTVSQFACGYRELYLPSFYTNPLFFPSTYGRSCGIELLKMVATHYGYQCDQMRMQAAIACLEEGLGKRGISTKRLHRASSMLLQNGVNIVFLSRSCRLLPSGKLNLPTIRVKQADLRDAITNPTIIKILVFRVRYDGTLDVQGPGGMLEEEKEEKEEEQGARHYIGWDAGPRMVIPSADDLNQWIPQQIRAHIDAHQSKLPLLQEDTLPDMKNVWEINRDRIQQNMGIKKREADKREQQAKRKRKRVEMEEEQQEKEEVKEEEMKECESEEGEKAWIEMRKQVGLHLQSVRLAASTCYVCVMDVESFLGTGEVPPSTSDKNDEMMQYMEEGAHYPFLIHYATFKLRREETLSFHEKTTHREAQQVLKDHMFCMGSTEGDNCFTHFFHQLGLFCIQNQISSIFVYAHNGAKYDYVLALSNLRALPAQAGSLRLEKPCYTSRGLISANIVFTSPTGDKVTMKLRDTLCYLSSSLKSCCQNLGVPSSYWKHSFDFQGFTKSKFESMSQEQRVAFDEYAKHDIYSLCFILLRLENMMQIIYPIPDHEVDFHDTQSFKPRCSFTTLQSLIRSLLRKYHFQPNEFIGNHFIPYDNMLLSALRGGCVQTTCLRYVSPLWGKVSDQLGQGATILSPDLVAEILDPSHLQYTLTALDATSLYPTVMSLFLLPRGGSGFYMDSVSGTHFVAQCRDRSYGRENWGIFLVNITHVPEELKACKFGLLSYRRKQGDSILYCNAKIADLNEEELSRLNHDYLYQDKDGDFYSFYTTDHLSVYAMAGVQFEVHSGIAFKKDSDCMSSSYKQFIDTMFAKRMEHKENPLLNNLYKLVMNGSFGSSGMKLIDTKHITISNKHFTLDDTDNGPIIDYEIRHMHTDVANVKHIIPLFKDETHGPQQLLVKLKALKGHSFNEISCKSTSTSRVTAAAFRYMAEALQDGGNACSPPRSFTSMLNEVHYMDTDSLFLPTPLARTLASIEPYCYSDKLGGMKDEYGAPILYMVSPMSKVRKVAVLQKQGENYGVRYVCKFKGLPMGPSFQHGIFEEMLRDLKLQCTKTVWNRSLQAGVLTTDTTYQVDFAAMFVRSKSGIEVQEDGKTVRLLPPHHVAETEEDRESCLYFNEETEEGSVTPIDVVAHLFT